jgi:hypothetical protein
MENELYKNLDKLESEELLYKVSNAMLTDEANSIAIKILEERGEPTEKIKASEINSIKAYGLASKNEVNLSRNSFINLFLCIFLPIISAGILTIGIEFTKGMNLFARTLASLATIGMALLIIKLAYIQVFKKDDKINLSVKVILFAPTILVTVFFICASVFNSFR